MKSACAIAARSPTSRHESRRCRFPAPAACRARCSPDVSARTRRHQARAYGRSRAATKPAAVRSPDRWLPPPSFSIRIRSRAGSTIPKSCRRPSARRSTRRLPPARSLRSRSPRPARIDRDNILRASLWALARAVAALPVRPKLVFVDGRDRIDAGCDCEAVISRRRAWCRLSRPPRSSPRWCATG